MKTIGKLMMICILFVCASLYAGTAGIFTGGDAGEGLDLSGTMIYAVNLNGPDQTLPNDSNDLLEVTFTDSAATPGFTTNIAGGVWGNKPEYGDTARDNALENIMHGSAIGTSVMSMDISGGAYKVQLLTSENWLGSQAGSLGGPYGPNLRVYDISIEGQLVGDDIDMWDVVGPQTDDKAMVFTHMAVVSDGTLNIVLTGVGGVGILQAITVEQLEETTPASNPSPVDGAEGVPSTGQSFSWNKAVPGSGTVAGQNLYYFVTDAPTANPDFSGVTPVFIADTPDPLTYSPDDFGVDKYVYWKVDNIVNNSSLVGDPNIPGVVWSFITEGDTPKITTDLEPLTLAYPDESPVLAFEFSSPLAPTVQWHKIDGTDVVVTGESTTSTGGNGYITEYTVSSVDEIADHGDQYYCIVSNTAGSITSVTTTIGVKRLEAHWTLDIADYDSVDPNYFDASVHGNNASVAGTATFVEGADGSTDGAVQINSTTAGTADGGTFDPMAVTGQLTVSAWVKWDGSAGLTTIVAKRSGWEVGPGGVQWQLLNNGGTVFINALVELGAPGGSSSTPLPVDEWALVTVTYDGQMLQFYRQGSPDGSATMPAMGEGSDAAVRIGVLESGLLPMNGALDDVRLYNYALSQAEIAQLVYDFTGETTCATKLAADINGDCIVDSTDLGLLISDWLADPDFDLAGDPDIIDLEDFADFSSYWLNEAIILP